jgi:hypothetical protein
MYGAAMRSTWLSISAKMHLKLRETELTGALICIGGGQKPETDMLDVEMVSSLCGRGRRKKGLVYREMSTL